MGYTHYWTDFGGARDLPAQAVTQIKQITDEAFLQGLIQRDWDDARTPLVTPREVRFNGVGGQGHQTFRYSTARRDALGFCRTERKLYDATVMRVLLILGYHREGLEISSDGEFRVEWAEALAWCNREIGAAYVKTHLAYWRPIKASALGILDF